MGKPAKKSPPVSNTGTLRTEANRRKRALRHAKLLAFHAGKKLRVKRGTGRAKRRMQMEKFRAAQRDRNKRGTGRVFIDAPSINRVGEVK